MAAILGLRTASIACPDSTTCADKFSHPPTSSGAVGAMPGLEIAAQLMPLNRRFIDWLRLVNVLPEITARRLAELEPAACDRVAQCPFTLFSLEMDTPLRWRPLIDTARRESGSIVHDAQHAERDAVASAALCLTWHLAQGHVTCARAVMGVHVAVAEALRALPIANLPVLAALASPLLRPRWPDSVHFWGDLLRDAATPAVPELTRTYLYGRQRIAAESMGLIPRRRSRASRRMVY